MMRGGDVGIMDNATKKMTLVSVLEWQNGGGHFVHTEAQSGLVDTTCARVLATKMAPAIEVVRPVAKKRARTSSKR